MWLTNEIYSQLRMLKAYTSYDEAKLFLQMIEGAIIQRQSHNDVDERDKQFQYFIAMFYKILKVKAPRSGLLLY